MNFPIEVWKNIYEISFTGYKTSDCNQKAENSKEKVGFIFRSEDKKPDMIQAHNQYTAEQKKVEIKGLLSYLPNILGHAQQYGFPGAAFTVMEIWNYNNQIH